MPMTLQEAFALCVLLAITVTGLAALVPLRGRQRRRYYGIDQSLREHQQADWRRGQDGPSAMVNGRPAQFGHYVGKYGKGRAS